MLTLSAIKADVGSIGGHTRPSRAMVDGARAALAQAGKTGLIIDFDITYTGDDICLLMVHDRGQASPQIHNLAWSVFEDASHIARQQGLYGAGQDLLADAPSGNDMLDLKGMHPESKRMTRAMMVLGKKVRRIYLSS